MLNDALWTVMISVALVALLIGFFVHALVQSTLNSQKILIEAFKDSLETIKASTLKEREEVRNFSEEAKINREAWKDQIAKELEDKKAPEPKYARTADGSRIDLNDYEVM